MVKGIALTHNIKKVGVCKRIWLVMFTILFLSVYLVFQTTRTIGNDVSSLRAAHILNPVPDHNTASATPKQSPVPEQSTDRAVPEQKTNRYTPELRTDRVTQKYSPGFEESNDRAYSSIDLRNVLKTTSGNGWTMWDRKAPLKLDDEWNCKWTIFKATNGKTAPMCVHEDSDMVSNSIVKTGRWGDCNDLSQIWEQSGPIKRSTEHPVYVEIGANIGSCVMEMLLASDAPIVAFEPHPKNQFCLTSTLMALSQEQRDRVSFFPIALGSDEGSSTIHAAKGNMGNSVVGSVIKDSGFQSFYPPMPIQVERLDTIFNTDNDAWNIPLMKMDAQGFECHILDGMAKVLDFLATVKSELASNWLIGQGCSDAGMLDRLRAANFRTYLSLMGQPFHLLLGEPKTKGIHDILAKNDNWHQRSKTAVKL